MKLHLKLTSAMLSAVMCASMIMTPVSVIADDSAAPEETQTTEEAEKEEPKETKPAPKETEKPAPKETEKKDPEETEKPEEKETEEPAPEETESKETESAPTEQQETEPAETEEKKPSETEETVPQETDPEESATVPEESAKRKAANNITAVGTCGENLTWTLDEDGTLAISGSGNMDDWEVDTENDNRPWSSYKDQIISVKLSESVTNIGKKAFYDFGNLGNITIPESVTTIGDFAFSYCSKLTRITIPDSVTTIESGAFRNCTSLTNIIIPNSVTSIEKGTFFDCTSLKSITISNGVTTIGYRAFNGCTSLTSITIPDSVTTIESDAFRNCTSLTNIIIPNSVTSIKNDILDNCTSLENATIPMPRGFNLRGLNSLKSVTISNGATTINDHAFQGCKNLTSITIPDSVTTIGKTAFSACSSLTSITIPNSVTTIEDYTFDNCTSLTNIKIPNSITAIGKLAFYACTSLTSITISNGVTTIGEKAFLKCQNLTSVYIPNSVTMIEQGAFDKCDSLSDVYYGGTRSQRAAMKIESDNGDLITFAKWHYSVPVNLVVAYYDHSGEQNVLTADDNKISGTVSFDKKQFYSDDVITVTATPNPGFALKEIMVTDTSSGTSTDITVSKQFTSGTDGVDIVVRFQKLADNTMTASGKTAKVKYKKLRKKKQTVARAKVMNVSNAQGNVTYKLTGVKRGKSKKYKKYFKINSTNGNVTIKKKLKKGTYKVTCVVTAAGDTNYKAGTKTVTFKIKVK